MRAATILARGQIDWWPENVFRGCCPCICLTLKLLSLHSSLSYVTACSFPPPPPTLTEKRPTFLPVMCALSSVCVCLCVFREREHEGVPIHCFGEFKVILLCFANWRSTSSSKVVLNSAVIPIPASHFHLTFPGLFKRLPVSSLWSAAACPTCLARPIPPCQAL